MIDRVLTEKKEKIKSAIMCLDEVVIIWHLYAPGNPLDENMFDNLHSTLSIPPPNYIAHWLLLVTNDLFTPYTLALSQENKQIIVVFFQPTKQRENKVQGIVVLAIDMFHILYDG